MAGSLTCESLTLLFNHEALDGERSVGIKDVEEIAPVTFLQSGLRRFESLDDRATEGPGTTGAVGGTQSDIGMGTDKGEGGGDRLQGLALVMDGNGGPV